MKGKDPHIFVAYDENMNAVGFVRLEANGKSFVDDYFNLMNIASAYVTKEARKLGTAEVMFAETQKWMYENGYRLCSVGYEPVNIPGSNFWNRYFTPYSLNLTRRIDERVITY